jgi:uncharacterized protein
MSDETFKVGAISWHDLTIENAAAARDFYQEVIGWQATAQPMGDYDDFNMNSSDEQETVAGICHARGANANMPPQWIIYVNVANVEKSALRCQELGGKVIDGPRKMGPYNFCVIQDPEGAVLGLISK